MLSSAIYRKRDWGTEHLDNLHKIILVLKGHSGIQSQVVWLNLPHFTVTQIGFF